MQYSKCDTIYIIQCQCTVQYIYVLYFVANVISLLARPPIQRDSQDRGYESDFIVFVKPGPNIFATL